MDEFFKIPRFSNLQIRLSHLAQLRGMHSDVIRRMIDSIGYVADYCKALKREAAVRALARFLKWLQVIIGLVIDLNITTPFSIC